MFHDTEWFEDIPHVDEATQGDVFFFTPTGGKTRLNEFEPQYDKEGNITNFLEMPRVHLALSVGNDEAEEPLLMHANFRDKGVGMWPLKWFMQRKVHQEIAAIKRLKVV